MNAPPTAATVGPSRSRPSPSRARLALRAGLALAFFGAELIGIAWGLGTPDHTFAFQMFNESSRFTIHLKREVSEASGAKLVAVRNGRWRSPDPAGKLREYAWQDRVRYFPLSALERSVHARYGLQAQLFHLQAALDDVAAHLPDDTRTLALVAEVETEQNGSPGRATLRAEKR